METVEQPRAAVDHSEFRVLLLDDLKPTRREWRVAGIGSAIVHIAFLVILVSIPREMSQQPPARTRHTRVTPLLDPPARLTQKAPNKAPIADEISVAPAAPAPKVAPVPKKRFTAPPPAQVAQRRNPAPPQEPPKITAQLQPAAQIVPPAELTPSAVRPPEQPKLVLESPAAAPQSGQGTGRLKAPGGGIQEAVRELTRSGGSSKSVGDDTEDIVLPGINPKEPSATRPKSSLELLSDPQGVDMKPYLLQVLQNVRRNWLTIYPESARMGRRGRVVVQFAIAPSGKITKVVFAPESGAQALDRAAVAALSMSDPLPQLPAAFKGDRIVLQFTFLYNAPR